MHAESRARNYALSADAWLFIRHNQSHLSRVYPAGFRVSSSNYEPQEMWAAGCQIVALNYQTPSHEMCINQGMFRDNGGASHAA